MNKLAQYLAGLRPGPEGVHLWPGGVRLRSVCYLGADLPLLEWVTSVRGVVLRKGEVLVVRDPESVHILPGGRRNPGESLLETLAREVLEETGWQIAPPHLLGVIWFHHLTPQPPANPYPYPDFLQLVYCAEAIHYLPERREVDGYELEAGFYPLAKVTDLAIPAGQQFFLKAACQQIMGVD